MIHRIRLVSVLLVMGLLLGIFAWFDRTDMAHASEALPSPSLKQLAKERNLQFGAYAARDRLPEPQYKDLLLSQFDFIVVDGQPNWQFEDGQLRPGPNEYDFSRMDEIMKLAHDNGRTTQVHHFVWGEEKWLPTWLKDGNYSEEALLNLLHDHIMTMGQRYRGQVREYTVVNEAFTRGQHVNGLRDWWGDHIGPEYIDKSFIWAHEADPNAKLLLNDFNSERQNSISDAMYNQVAHMKANNIPIDGIGMQMHIDGSKPPSKDEVIANMRRFGALGIKVYVTEFDVNMQDATGSISEKQQKQKQIYHDMLSACMESGVCPSFAVLGITDKESWYNEMGFTKSQPLPFDRNYQPKPAYFGMRDALLEH